MKTNVLPGEQLVFYVHDMKNNAESYPVMATALVIHRGAITVAEVNSQNGLAKIVCHNGSKANGSYWYEYKDQRGTWHSQNVVQLKRIKGEGMIFPPFIIEDED